MRNYGAETVHGTGTPQVEGRCIAEVYTGGCGHQCLRRQGAGSVPRPTLEGIFCWQHARMAYLAMGGGYGGVYVPEDFEGACEGSLMIPKRV